MKTDYQWMNYALSLANSAGRLDEVPVGALVVLENKLVSTGINLREKTFQATAHAEIMALQEAFRILGRWRLQDCELYVTLEPCLMCAGALYQSRIKRVVFGCNDPKGGALGSLFEVNKDTRLNHRYPVEGGLLSQECSLILKRFFSGKRLNKPHNS